MGLSTRSVQEKTIVRTGSPDLFPVTLGVETRRREVYQNQKWVDLNPGSSQKSCPNSISPMDLLPILIANVSNLMAS